MIKLWGVVKIVLLFVVLDIVGLTSHPDIVNNTSLKDDLILEFPDIVLNMLIRNLLQHILIDPLQIINSKLSLPLINFHLRGLPNINIKNLGIQILLLLKLIILLRRLLRQQHLHYLHEVGTNVR